MELKWYKYNDLYMPLFLWEFIKYLFEIEDNNLNSRRRKKISQIDFIKYLKNKYDFIDFDNIEIPLIAFFEKRKIHSIIKNITSSLQK